MSNYAIKVLSCRHGRISYLSTETLQWLNREVEHEQESLVRHARHMIELGEIARDNGYRATASMHLNRAFELLMPPDPHHIDIKLGTYRHRLVLRALAALESLNKHK